MSFPIDNSRAGALITIIRNSRASFANPIQYRRVRDALETLGLGPAEKRRVLVYLDYHDPKTQEPYERFVKAVP